MEMVSCGVLAVAAVLASLSGCVASREHQSSHTNNWAVLVCASRYWFNYRHVANTLSMYRSVKRLGIPDSNIILMLADDMACNARNPRPATVFNNANQHINVYGDDIEVDYRGYEVTVENFLRVLTGRLDSSVPRSKRLLTDDRSNILVYMTGHGGEGFLKFQDAEEISNLELGDAFEQMWQKRRYNELMFIIDTCQAGSMFTSFYSPNIVATGSSSVNEDSLSHHMDSAIGVHIIDRWTYYALEFLEKVTPSSQSTLADFFASFDPAKVKSTPQVRTDLFGRQLSRVLVTDFFGSVRNIELLNQTLTGGEGQGEGEGQEGGESSQDTGEPLPPARYLTPHDALAIPLPDKGPKVSNVLELLLVGFFMSAVTVATTVGIYRVVIA